MKRVATIILNRNLPKITDNLYENIDKYNSGETDIYVIESGSSPNNLSKYCSYRADWEEAIANGLRYARGFNFALSKLYEEGKFNDYDFYFFLCNDAMFEKKPIVNILLQEIEQHPRVGILSPCSDKWGEKKLFKGFETKYFWFMNHIAWFIRRGFIEDIMEMEDPNYLNFLYDGSNFRGYECDIELIVKGYANDWAAAITTKVKVAENEELLKQNYKEMKTDEYHINREKLLIEGKKWLRRKYGFNSRWTMQLYAKFFYDKFFEYYPEFIKYKI